MARRVVNHQVTLLDTANDSFVTKLKVSVDITVVGLSVRSSMLWLTTVESAGPMGQVELSVFGIGNLENVPRGLTHLGVVCHEDRSWAIFARVEAT